MRFIKKAICIQILLMLGIIPSNILLAQLKHDSLAQDSRGRSYISPTAIIWKDATLEKGENMLLPQAGQIAMSESIPVLFTRTVA